MLSVRNLRQGGPRYCRRDGYKSTPRPSVSVAASRICCQLHRHGVSQLWYCAAGLHCLPRTALVFNGVEELILIDVFAQPNVREVRRWSRQMSKQRQWLVKDAGMQVPDRPTCASSGSASQRFEEAAIETTLR
jgi:hypothetical protein